jgi:hypothetical protein
MNSAIKLRTYRAVGACTGIAGLLLLVAVIAGAGPLGQSVGIVTGGGFAFGLLACAIKEVLARRGRRAFAAVRPAQAAIAAAQAAARRARVLDATAQGVPARRHRPAAITSLTEVQALRQRALRRQERQRAIRTGA